ncbi:putative flippase [Cyclobacterium qasimii]|uniref:Putative flippase n=1 Tax=Cyclobacterium qasimii M12-11B TaxID=641524 RepID=S7WM71_9BACT|nr:putative flippase [Cyclobacterium qasimii]EPR67844.1 putative flippase [Cyclobacterium qasimii M12-11B]
MQAGNKILINTGILYFKLIVSVAISLFTTRLILSALGTEDFGIFSVVGGVISLLGFINVAMTTTTQRFLSFSLGLEDVLQTRKVFANSIILHLFIGFLLLIVFETVGVYFLNNHLNIASERLQTANYLLQFIIGSTFLVIISVPYDGLANAHENMLFLSILDIFESIGKLCIAFILLNSSFDKLLLYGFLLFILTLLVRIIKWIYCNNKYVETKFNYKNDFEPKKIKEMSSFASWNLFGVLSSIGNNSGTAIVLNIYFGTIVNAAFGIAQQVNGQLSFLSQTLMKAIKPQMTKSEGSGNRARTIKLSIISSKFSFYLYSFVSIPLFFELPLILSIWLKDVPENTIVFCKLILVINLVRQFSMGIMSAVQAIGKIRLYQTVAGSMQLLVIPIGIVFYNLNYPNYTIFLIALLMEILSTIFRVYYFSFLTKYNVIKYITEVLLNL